MHRSEAKLSCFDTVASTGAAFSAVALTERLSRVAFGSGVSHINQEPYAPLFPDNFACDFFYSGEMSTTIL